MKIITLITISLLMSINLVFAGRVIYDIDQVVISESFNKSEIIIVDEGTQISGFITRGYMSRNKYVARQQMQLMYVDNTEELGDSYDLLRALMYNENAIELREIKNFVLANPTGDWSWLPAEVDNNLEVM